MEHQTSFKQKVLPHYLKVITEVVTLDDIVSNCSDQDLSRVENRLRTAVTTAYTEIQEAVEQGNKVNEDVSNEIRDAMKKKQEIENKRKELLKLRNELITAEKEKEEKQAELKQVQAMILQIEETQEAENSRKAEKETLRDVGFGLLILPFVGIPLALGANREMKCSEQQISNTSEKLSKMKVDQDRMCEELTNCQTKVEKLRLEQVEVDNELRGNEVDLQVKQGHINQLNASWKKVLNSIDHLTALQTELEVVYKHCKPDSYPGINLVQKLQKLISLVQGQSFGLELLGDPRVVSKLSQLDERRWDGALSVPGV